MKLLTLFGLFLLFCIVSSRVVEKRNKKWFFGLFDSGPPKKADPDYYLKVLKNNAYGDEKIECRIKISILLDANSPLSRLGLPLYDCRSDPAPGKTLVKQYDVATYYILLWKNFPRSGDWCAYNPNGYGKFFFNNGNSNNCRTHEGGQFYFMFQYQVIGSCIDFDTVINQEIMGAIRLRSGDWYNRVNQYKQQCTAFGEVYATQTNLMNTKKSQLEFEFQKNTRMVKEANEQIVILNQTLVSTRQSYAQTKNEFEAIGLKKASIDMRISQQTSLIEKTEIATKQLREGIATSKEVTSLQTKVTEIKTTFQERMTSLLEVLEGDTELIEQAKEAVLGSAIPDLVKFNKLMAKVLPIVDAETKEEPAVARMKRRKL